MSSIPACEAPLPQEEDEKAAEKVTAEQRPVEVLRYQVQTKFLHVPPSGSLAWGGTARQRAGLLQGFQELMYYFLCHMFSFYLLQ